MLVTFFISCFLILNDWAQLYPSDAREVANYGSTDHGLAPVARYVKKLSVMSITRWPKNT
jgi:hypothetical protein